MKWSGGAPKTLAELFDFYHNYVKILYADICTQNTLPDETLFELNAALDHISRHWAYGETEEAVVKKAYSHLKRSCLDVFKIRVQDARREFDELRKIDTSVLDNGEFDRNLIVLFSKIRSDATEARSREGMLDENEEIPAFDLWGNVHANCTKLHTEFYLHKSIPWAKRRDFAKSFTANLVSFIIGVASSYLVWAITSQSLYPKLVRQTTVQAAIPIKAVTPTKAATPHSAPHVEQKSSRPVT